MTGKSIKLSQATYDRLCEIARPRETFDREINRLLNDSSIMSAAAAEFLVSPEYQAWKAKRDAEHQ